MGAVALKNEAFDLIEKLPESKINYVIQFAKFLFQQDFSEQSVPLTLQPAHLPLGFLKGKAKVHFSDDWEMSAEELLGL